MNGFAAAACDGTTGVGDGKDKTYTFTITQTSDVYIDSVDDPTYNA